MKSALIVALLGACLAVGLVVAEQRTAAAGDATVERVTAPAPAPVAPPTALTSAAEAEEVVAKSCGFDSDCSHGKCSKGKCGACGFDSDCKGWGKCSQGQCGSCGFDSECKGFGSCSSGKCTKSPY